MYSVKMQVADYAHHFTACPPRFENLSTPLIKCDWNKLFYLQENMDPDLQMKPADFFSLTFQEQIEYISQKVIWGEPLSHLWVSKM